VAHSWTSTTRPLLVRNSAKRDDNATTLINNYNEKETKQNHYSKRQQLTKDVALNPKPSIIAMKKNPNLRGEKIFSSKPRYIWSTTEKYG